MSPPHRLRAVGAIVVLTVWIPATAFFVTIGLLVARQLVERGTDPAPAITTVASALVTMAYSLGGAVVGLGLAWLALPRVRARGLRWSAVLWVCTTAFLLATRHVDGWQLLVAALVAVGIAVDVVRRLILTVIEAARARSSALPAS